MQLNRVGNLEQESDLLDLDQLEREMESELEDDVADDVQPQVEQPLATVQKTAAPQQNVANGRGKGLSKFMPQAQVNSSFFPGQPAVAVDKAETKEKKRDVTSSPLALVDSKFDARLRQKPANNSKPKMETVDVGPSQPQNQNTPRSSRSRFARATVEALLSMGTLPMQMLIELGRFRFAKENRFNSLQRLEKALGQGNEDAERYLNYNPGKARKKDPAPPAPGNGM